jgi:hypothetical protein
MARLFYLEHKMKVLLATSSPTPQLSSFFAKSMAETYEQKKILNLFFFGPQTNFLFVTKQQN